MDVTKSTTDNVSNIHEVGPTATVLPDDISVQKVKTKLESIFFVSKLMITNIFTSNCQISCVYRPIVLPTYYVSECNTKQEHRCK